MNDVYDFMDFRNQTHSTIERLQRIDIRDYPEIALREVLLNLLVHRDYSLSASSFIRIYSNRIEFVSIGGLMSGMDLEDIMMGISICRNQDLANVFYRLLLIEAYGTGLTKIMKAYEDEERKPTISISKNAFRIILPNRNVKYDRIDDFGSSTSIIRETENKYLLNEDEEKIMEYTKENGFITRNDVMELLDVSASTALRAVRKLTKDNLLKQEGRARSTRYKIVKK